MLCSSSFQSNTCTLCVSFRAAFLERWMPVTVVNEGDEVILNCTASSPDAVAIFQGPPPVLTTPTPPGDRVWNFTAIPEYSGRYSCTVSLESTLEQTTILIVIPGREYL